MKKNATIVLSKSCTNLRKTAKKVYVITAGHDYNDSVFILKDDGCMPVEGTDFDELCDMYRDFGYGDAIAFDAATHSYIAEITDGVRMLAICCDSKRQPKGAMDDRLMAWIKEQLDKAKKDRFFTESFSCFVISFVNFAPCLY